MTRLNTRTRVQVFDTPVIGETRPADDSPVTDQDCVDTMEMVLGALGRDAAGIGAGGDNPAGASPALHVGILHLGGVATSLGRAALSLVDAPQPNVPLYSLAPLPAKQNRKSGAE